MRAFYDPSTPVLGCADCGTPVGPSEEKCLDCILREAEVVRFPSGIVIAVLVLLGMASALLVPLCWMLWQIVKGGK